MISKFRQLLKDFFKKFKKEKTPKPFIYLAIGDSTIEGVGASSPERNFAHLIYQSIKQKNPNVEYHNLGIAGDRVEDVISKQLQKAIELQPNLIVLSVGGNDLMQRRKLSVFRSEFEKLMEGLKSTGSLIIVNNIPDLSLAPAVPKIIRPYCSIQTTRFNKIIREISVKNHAIFIDLQSQSKLFRGYSELISSDGLHPSDAGYALWANTIITTLKYHQS